MLREKAINRVFRKGVPILELWQAWVIFRYFKKRVHNTRQVKRDFHFYFSLQQKSPPWQPILSEDAVAVEEVAWHHIQSRLYVVDYSSRTTSEKAKYPMRLSNVPVKET